MKTFLLGTLQFIWKLFRLACIVVGTIGMFLSTLLLLLCIGGLFLNAIIGGWKDAVDLSLAPLLVSLATVAGFSFVYALGKFDHESC